MATISKALVRTPASTSTQTLYTTPADTTAVVTNIVISNRNASTVTATLSITVLGATYPGGNGPSLVPDVEIPAYSIMSIDLKQVMDDTESITGKSSGGNFVTFNISGVEIN
jgi:hypothetical protein